MKNTKEKDLLDLEDDMREEYDFENMQCIPNPYIKLFKKQMTININDETINYFKKEASLIGIPYQILINLYLTDCVKKKKKIKIDWE